MKRRIFILISLVCAAVMLLLLPGIIKPDIKTPAIDESIVYSSELFKYTMRSYKGAIGIFKNNEPEPFEIIDIDISKLPQHDANALNKGIIVLTEEELYRRIEDFTS